MATVTYAQDFSISGKILDQENSSISFANVLVLNAQDSTVIKGTSTAAEGVFGITAKSEKNYILKVSYIGFQDYYTNFRLEKDLHFGDIRLAESTEILDEIQIYSKRPVIKKQADRLIFDIESSALTEGNMLQVLQSTPGVLIIDGAISIKSTTPTVYINDKKAHLTNDELIELLEGSSASAVKSVEVITNPSSKYDASSAAILNIVMSKKLITGYRGNVFANYKQAVFGSYETGMSHFFRSDKINVFGNYSYASDKINRDGTQNISYLDANQNLQELWKTKTNRNTWTERHNLNVNLDYQLDDKNTIGLSSYALISPYFKYKTSSKTSVFDTAEDLNFMFDTQNSSYDDKNSFGVDLDYRHRFTKDGELLSFNAHHTSYEYKRRQQVTSFYFDEDSTPLDSNDFKTSSNQSTAIYTANLDYTLPIDSGATFETGLKASQIETESAISQYDLINGSYILNSNHTDQFDYNETILAGYVNYSKTWERLELVAGLRAEQTQIKGLSKDSNEDYNSNYLDLFPSLSLSYTATENVSVYSNFKRSIERPDYQNLNPFQFYINDNTIVTGNPALQPVYASHATIGTSLFDLFTLEAYYKHSKNMIIELPIQDNTNSILSYTPINLDKTEEFGFDILAYFNITPAWSVYAVTSFYHTEGQTTLDTLPVKLNQWSNYSELQNDIGFLKDRSLSLNFSLIYGSRNLQGIMYSDDMLISNLAISKSILNKKGSLSLSISDLFNTQEYRTTTRFLNQNNSNTSAVDSRYVKVGFRYKFGNSNLTSNERQKAHDEIDRL